MQFIIRVTFSAIFRCCKSLELKDKLVLGFDEYKKKKMNNN